MPLSSAPLCLASTLTQILQALDVRLVSDGAIYHCLTDSRSLQEPKHTLFFAIETATGDGHRYLNELYARGVRFFVVEQPLEELLSTLPEANLWQVHSSTSALQALARNYRNRWTMPVVGITGSNGKTIVKEFVATLLSRTLRVGRSPRSYNSQIGVPLSILQIEPEMELALIEAGISERGEMKRLEEIIRPEVGIFTGLGRAHLENFDSQAELLSEKLQLFTHCSTLIVSQDDSAVLRALEERGWTNRLRSWSRIDSTAFVYVQQEKTQGNSTEVSLMISGQAYQYRIPFTDEAYLNDVLHALTAVAYLYPNLLASDDLTEGLAPVSMRLEVKESIYGNTIINDAYTSDLTSLRIALDFLRRRAESTGARTVIILSDLAGESEAEEDLYRQVADLLGHFGLHQLIAVGAALIRQQGKFSGLETSFYHTTEELLSSGALEQLRSSCILLKGARSFAFERIYRAYSLREHQTTLEINLSALVANLKHYRSLMPYGHRMICMIKADAYGLGAFEIARTLEEHRVDYLAVAVADEGKELRLRGIKSPILVMNPEPHSVSTLVNYALEPEVYSLELLESLRQELCRLGAKGFGIHIKLDTGMHRLGFMPHEISSLVHALREDDTLIVRSVFSHLASADMPELDDFTRGQFVRYDEMYEELREGLGYSPLRHILNTAGMERFASRAMDMSRLGIGLYGLSPTLGEGILSPVARLSTTILQVKTLEAGEYIGYGCRDRLTRPSRIAIIPIGYADGFGRKLGLGAYSVEVAGRLCPTIGSICMDACMIDVTDVPEPKAGDRVLLFGSSRLPIEHLAGLCGTISYEIISSISPRVQHIYYQE